MSNNNSHSLVCTEVFTMRTVEIAIRTVINIVMNVITASATTEYVHRVTEDGG